MAGEKEPATSEIVYQLNELDLTHRQVREAATPEFRSMAAGGRQSVYLEITNCDLRAGTQVRRYCVT